MEFIKLNIQLFGAFAEKENTSLVSKSGTNKGRVYAKFSEANATADDISKNQTRITPYGEYSQGGSYSGYNTPKLVLTWYDDNEHKNGLLLGTTPATSYANKEKIKVEPKEFAVKHKDDGTLNGYLKAEWIWTGSGYCCNSGSAVTSNTALTSIPRAKTISALSADIGYDTLITLKQTSKDYTVTITYECGELSGTIEEKTSETSIGWKIPTEIYSQLLPTDKEIDVKLTATTYNGDTQIGSSQTTTFKARVNEEDNRPLAYLDVEDVNEITTALTSDPNKVILNASSMLCNVQGMSKNGAIIKSMTINGIQLVDFAYRTPDEGTPEDITEIALDEFTIEKPTTNTFTLTVTDSRENTNNITVDNQRTLEKIDYIIPTISATFKRNTPVDGLVNVRYDGKFFNGLFKEGTPNTLQMAYQYRDKESDSEEYSEWIPLTVTTSETDNTYGGQLQLEEEFDYEKQFDFRLSVKDLVNDYGVVFTTGSIAKGKPSHWYDDENFYVEGDYYQRDKETGKWKKNAKLINDILNKKTTVGIDDKDVYYIRGTKENGEHRQLRIQDDYISYEKYDGTSWSTEWINHTKDTGWKDIPLQSGVSAGTIGERPQYRKVGNRVDIKGSYSFTKSTTNDLIGVLPEGFRPTGYIYMLCPVGGVNVMRVFVQASGNIYAEWIYNIVNSNQFAGKVNWCDINASFYVD